MEGDYSSLTTRCKKCNFEASPFKNKNLGCARPKERIDEPTREALWNGRSTGSLCRLFSAMFLSIVDTQAQAQSVMTRHVRPEVTSGQAKFLNRLPATQTLRIDIVLPLRDQADWISSCKTSTTLPAPPIGTSLRCRSLPRSLAPARQDYDAVVGFAKATALRWSAVPAMVWTCSLKGSVASVEAAFNVTMGVYQHPTENRTFYAPDREPTVDLPVPLWHISGLDNYSIPHPAALHKNVNRGEAQRHDWLLALRALIWAAT